jgi:hypothetical protein
LKSDAGRSLIARDNTFKAPIEQRRSDFENRLADALARRAGQKAGPRAF